MENEIQIEGLTEFEKLIYDLLFEENVTCSSIAKVLNEKTASVSTFKNGQKRTFTTKTLKKMEKTTNIKAMVVFFDKNDKETYEMLKKINEKSLKKLKQMILEEDKKVSPARKKLSQLFNTQKEYKTLIDEFTKLVDDKDLGGWLKVW